MAVPVAVAVREPSGTCSLSELEDFQATNLCSLSASSVYCVASRNERV